MFNGQVALVSEESSITPKELTAVAAALQKQVSRDFAPLWHTNADVSAFTSLNEVPLDYWPVVIKDDIGDPSAAGYHEDDHGQPYSLVQYGDDWTLTASHEVLEMLGDPFGRRMIAGQSPKPGQGRVKFLVEVCDPCEATEFSYTVNGFVMSDFYTPHYFDPVKAAGVRYSYRNSISAPREVLKGGYLSWYDPASRNWWQRTWFAGAQPRDKSLAALKIKNGNPRRAIDRVTALERAKAMKPTAKRSMFASGPAAKSELAFANQADDLRRAIRKVGR